MLPDYRKLLGKQTPRRGGLAARWLGSAILETLGWRITGNIPSIEKCVVIGAPHTSNFDGVVGLASVLALDWDIRILGKHTLFKFPILSNALRWLGVIPIERHTGSNVVDASIAKFASSGTLFLGIAPDGSRTGSSKWKTGFYRIAQAADVPILPILLDYASKQVIIAPVYHLTGDMEQDMENLIALYKGIEPRKLDRLSKPLKDLRN